MALPSSNPYTAGHALGSLAKAASEHTLTYSLTGRLQRSRTGWLVLTVPAPLVRGAFDALDEHGLEPPQEFAIPVISPQELQRLGGADKITERGHSFHYAVGGLVAAEPFHQGVSRVLSFTVKSPDLVKLRVSYGLDPAPGAGGFRLPVAVRKTHVMGKNDISKGAAAEYPDIHPEEPDWQVYSKEAVEAAAGQAPDKLPGGLADHRPDSSFGSEELEEGRRHELDEHTHDPQLAGEIAKDHLVENPHYYALLEKVEKSEEKKADDAKGIPNRSNYGDLPRLRIGQLLDYFAQEHNADRAGKHVDFRIGNQDLGLLSWAARKGLPEPGQKHLIVQQPLHDIAYGPWEGTIPKGQYGAGTVRSLEKGKMLVTKAEPGSIHLISAHDRFPRRYILEQLKDNPKNWLLGNVTPTEPVPYTKQHYKHIPASRAVEALQALEPGSSVQKKIDGAAMLLALNKNRPEAVSYRAQAATGSPIIHSERLFQGPAPKYDLPPEYRGSVLRGELYGLRGDKAIPPQELGGILNSGIEKAIQTQKDRGIRLRALLFDLEQLGKQPISKTEMPYAERLAKVKEIAQHLPEGFDLPEEARTPEEALAMWARISSGQDPLTQEGVVIHPVHGKPSKAKLREEQDVHLTGVFPGEGKYKDTGAGGFTYSLEPGGPTVGRVGTGLSDELRRDLWANPETYKGRIARVISQGGFDSGALRAPALLGLHEDYPSARSQEKSAAHPLVRALNSAARDVHPDPTLPQREALNYRSGHFRWHGMEITLEVAKGQVRKKKGKDGKVWQRLMKAHYGRLLKSLAADGDHLDVYVGEHPQAEIVFVIEQLDEKGQHDEYKVIIACLNREEAEKLYRSHYPRNWDRVGQIQAMTVPQFKQWAFSPACRKPPTASKSAAADTETLVHYARQPYTVLRPLSYDELAVDRSRGRWANSPDKVQDYVRDRRWLESALRRRLRSVGVDHGRDLSFLYATLAGKERFGGPDQYRHEAPLTDEVINRSFFDVVGDGRSRLTYGSKGLAQALKRWRLAEANGSLRETEYMGMPIRPRIEVITSAPVNPGRVIPPSKTATAADRPLPVGPRRVRILLPGSKPGTLLMQPAAAFTSLYRLPGGKVEQGEEPVAAALRELQEEFGATLEPKALVPLGRDPRPERDNHYFYVPAHAIQPGFYQASNDPDGERVLLEEVPHHYAIEHHEGVLGDLLSRAGATKQAEDTAPSWPLLAGVPGAALGAAYGAYTAPKGDWLPNTARNAAIGFLAGQLAGAGGQAAGLAGKHVLHLQNGENWPLVAAGTAAGGLSGLGVGWLMQKNYQTISRKQRHEMEKIVDRMLEQRGLPKTAAPRRKKETSSAWPWLTGLGAAGAGAGAYAALEPNLEKWAPARVQNLPGESQVRTIRGDIAPWAPAAYAEGVGPYLVSSALPADELPMSPLAVKYVRNLASRGRPNANLNLINPFAHINPVDAAELAAEVGNKVRRLREAVPDAPRGPAILSLLGHGAPFEQVIGAGENTPNGDGRGVTKLTTDTAFTVGRLLREKLDPKGDRGICTLLGGCNTGIETSPAARDFSSEDLETMGALPFIRGGQIRSMPALLQEELGPKSRVVGTMGFSIPTPHGDHYVTQSKSYAPGPFYRPSEAGALNVYTNEGKETKFPRPEFFGGPIQSFWAAPPGFNSIYQLGRPAALAGAVLGAALPTENSAWRAAMASSLASAPVAASELAAGLAKGRGKFLEELSRQSESGEVPHPGDAVLHGAGAVDWTKIIPHLALPALPLASYGLAKALGRWKGTPRGEDTLVSDVLGGGVGGLAGLGAGQYFGWNPYLQAAAAVGGGLAGREGLRALLGSAAEPSKSQQHRKSKSKEGKR